MKSYLSLIPISARIHKRQNRMTIFCIVLAVFLVTAIFSMADMEIRSQKIRAVTEYGNWHIMLKNLPKDDAQLIGMRPDVAAASWYDVINYRINEDYYAGGKRAVLCGAEEPLVNKMMGKIIEGAYPQDNSQILLSTNAKDILGVNTGDSIRVQTPSGGIDYVISGFNEDTAMITRQDIIGIFMPMDAFEDICRRERSKDSDPVYYVQFSERTDIRAAVADIQKQYGLSDEQISQNTALMGVMGFSSDSYMLGLYFAAAVLFVLVLTAGVLMIAGSLNSNIAQRTEFFGMLRCIGADRKQIIHFVRLEALAWCKIAIPIGVLLGVVVTWGLCAVLRFMTGDYFKEMPLFGVSVVGIVCGFAVGILTVLLAAQSPAKKAAKVSPLAAVSGNTENGKNIRFSVKARFCKIETALGIYHAGRSKKNFILMTGSFALSIILFLSFSAVISFMHHAINPLRPYTPDLSIISPDNTCSVSRNLLAEINGRDGVKRVFGRSLAYGMPANIGGIDRKIDLISYEAYQLNWADENDYVLDGDLSKVPGDSGYALVKYDQENPLKIGDKIYVNGGEIEIAGILSTCPFTSEEGTQTVICSEETFARLIGQTDYTIIDIQLTGKADDRVVNAIRGLAGDNAIFSDRRMSNREAEGAYWAFTLFIYGFLAIIAMITVFNIINSVSMSVSALTLQYGAMRAVGMDRRQVTKMIAAETLTYALSGCVAGCAVGLPIHRVLFNALVTAHWGDAWRIPITAIAVIVILITAASAAAIYSPAKRIGNLSVADVISAD